MQHTITIGPEFFAKAANDYSDRHWALIRELGQNSIDAPGCDAIHIDVSYSGRETTLTFRNNGEPMDKETLMGKLLCLGASGKNFQGSVGGFGKAKELCYLSQDNGYEILTGTLRVRGLGGNYDLVEDQQYLHGTHSILKMQGDHATALLNAARKFIAFGQWDGHITINGEVRKPDLKKGAPRRELGFGKIYTNHTFDGTVIVRVNGIPMFTRRTDAKFCVVVELPASQDYLTANRDSLTWYRREELDQFLIDLTVNKRAALKEQKRTEKIRYAGDKFKGHAELVTVRQGTSSILQTVLAAPQNVMAAREAGTAYAYSETEIATEASSRRVQRSFLDGDFIIRNECGLKIPACYIPETFSAYSKKLLRMWIRCLLIAHDVCKVDGQFSVGFLFNEPLDEEQDEGAEALFEQSDEHGRVYYISPVKLVSQKSSKSRSFARRFQLTDRYRVLADAVHEMTHAQHGNHDEAYANQLTDNFALVSKNIKKFGWCWR